MISEFFHDFYQDMCNAVKPYANHLNLLHCRTLNAIITCLCDIPPSLPHADVQRALNTKAPPAAGASVHFTDDSLQSSADYNKHMLPTEERSAQLNAKPAASTDLDFLPVNPPDSPVTSDVFQLAPFKMPTKDTAASGASFSASHKPSETFDIFLQAPFGKKQETTKTVSGSAHMLKQTQSVGASHLAGAPSPAVAQPRGPQPPFVHVETPLLQQPVAVHRVVSRIGQQAAVGSVAVGPLHAWTVGGRALEDPFTAAPFQPRCSHQKP